MPKKSKIQLPHETFNSIIFCGDPNAKELVKGKHIPVKVSKLPSSEWCL